MIGRKTIIKTKVDNSHLTKTISTIEWTPEEDLKLIDNFENGIRYISENVLQHRTPKSIESRIALIGITKKNKIPKYKTEFTIEHETIAKNFVPTYGIQYLYEHNLFQEYSKKVIWTWVTSTLKLPVKNIVMTQDNEVFNNLFEIN